MWQRIKLHIRHFLSNKYPLPIYLKLVFLYSAIVFCILLLTSVLTITSVHYILMEQVKTDVSTSAENITQYLHNYGTVDNTLFTKANLLPSVNLQVYDSSGHLILGTPKAEYKKQQSADRYINQQILGRIVQSIRDTIGGGDDLSNYSYYQTWSDKNNQLYYFHIYRNADKESEFINLLTQQLLCTILLSLIITVLSGQYLTKKTLTPIRTMCNTLANIEVNQLGKRIVVGDAKDELQELALTINKTLDRIEYGYKQQQQFVSDASHELRTPITVISGYVDLLDRWGKQDAATLQEGISAIKAETNYMRQLIERLLFFARSSKGTLSLRFSTVETSELLQEVYGATKLIAGSHRIYLEKNDFAYIYAEPGSIKQMLRIFIDNALKYTPDGGIIYLSGELKNDIVILKVRDTGMGIPEKNIPYVCDRFYRVDFSRTKETGGTGLGLSIANYIAEANNATLQIESKINEGTTIIVTLPRCNKR